LRGWRAGVGKSPRKWSRCLRYIRIGPSWMERVESAGYWWRLLGAAWNLNGSWLKAPV